MRFVITVCCRAVASSAPDSNARTPLVVDELRVRLPEFRRVEFLLDLQHRLRPRLSAYCDDTTQFMHVFMPCPFLIGTVPSKLAGLHTHSLCERLIRGGGVQGVFASMCSGVTLGCLWPMLGWRVACRSVMYLALSYLHCVYTNITKQRNRRLKRELQADWSRPREGQAASNE